jgi:hypothetical protein
MYRFVAGLVMMLSLVGPAVAQDLDAKAVMRLAAPYVNDTTQIVAYVNVPKLTLANVFNAIGAIHGPNKSLAMASDFAQEQQAKLRKAGIVHVVTVLNLSDTSGQQPPTIVAIAPLGANAAVDELLKMIGQVPGVTAKVEKGTLLVHFGPREAAAAKEQANFTFGMNALGDLPVRIVAAPSADVRKFMEQVVRQLPPALGGGDITPLARGMHWGGVGADPDQLAGRFVLQAKDSVAAGNLKAIVNKGVETLDKALDGKVRSLLEVKETKGRISVAVDKKAAETILQLAAAKAREDAPRLQTVNNLKQLALTMHVYFDANRILPARAIFDATGKPLLSWRVHVLPYIEQGELYNQFKLDEPWDSAHNKKLIAKIPPIYVSLFSKVTEPGKTTYLALTGKGSIFDGNKGISLRDITDGTSNTIFAVDANDTRAVIWTRPEDFPIDTPDPLAGLVRPGAKGFYAGFADGAARFIPTSIQPAQLRALFTRNGGERVNAFDLFEAQR